jgi:Immunoglobulin domain
MGSPGKSAVWQSNLLLCSIVLTVLFVRLRIDYGLDEIEPSQLPMGPVFVAQPRSTIYDSGSTQTLVTLNCEVSANPLPTYTWYVWRNQRRVEVDLKDQSKTVTNGRLTIQKPNQTKDNGDYQCRATNSLGAVLSDWATLSFGCKCFIYFLARPYANDQSFQKCWRFYGVPMRD